MTRSRWTLILDLDNTLICSVEDAAYARAATRAKLDAFMKSSAGKQSEMKYMHGCFRIYARPGLKDFLDFAFRHFNIVIWTAASVDYAWFIIHNFILADKSASRRNKILAVLCERHCTLSQMFMNEKSSPKHLPYLFKNFPELELDPQRTLFLDDHSQVQKHNPRQIIYTPAFEVLKSNATADTFMYDVQSTLLERSGSK